MTETCIVVGAGQISDVWFPPLKEEGVEIAAVVDLRLETAQAQIAKHQLQAEATTDLRAALERARPDFVVDLTVPAAHREVTITALRAGCHVIGEKPMAASMDAAREMVRTAEETGRLYMVSQSRRGEPHHEAVRRAIADQVIGRVTTINCDFYIGAHFGGFRDEMPSPLILDMAIHHFDLARFWTGGDPVAVFAREFNPAGSWYQGAAAASCVFEMTDGVVFTYRGGWCAEGFNTSWNGSWRIIGERGTLVYENDEQPRAQVVAGDEGFARPLDSPALPEVTLEATAWRAALREMLDYLRTGRLPATECHDNIKSLAMTFAAIDSSREARRVAVEAL